MVKTLDEFTTAYIECALWSSTDDTGENNPLDQFYSVDNIAPEAMEKIIADCAKFQAENAAMIGDDAKFAGHDFWLTRNGHGAGFWDGGWREHGDALTEASKAFGECYFYVGDDEKLYIQ